MSAKLFKTDRELPNSLKLFILSLRQMFIENLKTKQFMFNWMNFFHLGQNNHQKS